ncbi:MAG: aminoglycoside phosphotransferase family protein [Oscillospiraceae bacterium]|nr:aminoglycoside phosphotransferase family protein [Oscillospiraceae bacterium]
MQLNEIISAFAVKETIVRHENFGGGHINSTFKVTAESGRKYILQRINQNVFSDPVALMGNVRAVSEYIRCHSDGERRSLEFVPTAQGGVCYQDEEGVYWRLYRYVDGLCLDVPECDEDFYQSAVAFGQFLEWLKGFPVETLYEPIPNFHNTPYRYRQLKEAIEKNGAGRCESARREIEIALKLEEAAGVLQAMRESGVLPLRVTHNDTKLNNVLLDPHTRQYICVLDLDTVMPGLSAYDFGDAIRFGAATAAEDEQDASKMRLDLHLFEVFARGFIQAAPSLTKEEIQALPLGAFTMTLEVGIRFLADYLNGDVYFKTAYPEHNLVRTRTQLTLANDMIVKRKEMERIIAEIVAELQ